TSFDTLSLCLLYASGLHSVCHQIQYWLLRHQKILYRQRCLSTPKGAGPIMKTLLFNFVNDEQGQDLIEYTLLLAFVCLASAALFISAGGSVSGIWTATNSRLAAANTSASS